MQEAPGLYLNPYIWALCLAMQVIVLCCLLWGGYYFVAIPFLLQSVYCNYAVYIFVVQPVFAEQETVWVHKNNTYSLSLLVSTETEDERLLKGIRRAYQKLKDSTAVHSNTPTPSQDTLTTLLVVVWCLISSCVMTAGAYHILKDTSCECKCDTSNMYSAQEMSDVNQNWQEKVYAFSEQLQTCQLFAGPPNCEHVKLECGQKPEPCECQDNNPSSSGWNFWSLVQEFDQV